MYRYKKKLNGFSIRIRLMQKNNETSFFFHSKTPIIVSENFHNLPLVYWKLGHLKTHLWKAHSLEFIFRFASARKTFWSGIIYNVIFFRHRRMKVYHKDRPYGFLLFNLLWFCNVCSLSREVNFLICNGCVRFKVFTFFKRKQFWYELALRKYVSCTNT